MNFLSMSGEAPWRCLWCTVDDFGDLVNLLESPRPYCEYHLFEITRMSSPDLYAYFFTGNEFSTDIFGDQSC